MQIQQVMLTAFLNTARGPLHSPRHWDEAIISLAKMLEACMANKDFDERDRFLAQSLITHILISLLFEDLVSDTAYPSYAQVIGQYTTATIHYNPVECAQSAG